MIEETSARIRVAFASTDQIHVDLHFGAAERFVVYDVGPGQATLVGIGQFAKAQMKGANKDRHRRGEMALGEPLPPPARCAEEPPVTEDKVIAKLDFLSGCMAVYASSIGSSSIRRLMEREIQPIIVDQGQAIEDVLNELSAALCSGELP